MGLELGVADALLVQHELAPRDDETRARLVDLVLGVPSTTAGVPDDADPVVPAPASGAPPPEPPARRGSSLLGQARSLVRRALAGLASTRTALTVPDWFPVPPRVESELVELDRPAGPALPGAPMALPGPSTLPAVPPLLRPDRTAAILLDLLSTRGPVGEIDTARLVARMAQLRPIGRIARRERRRSPRRILLLTDLSEDMLPFRDDLISVTARVRRVFGADRVLVLKFSGRPATAVGPGTRATWDRMVPVHPTDGVLLLTNFRESAAEFAEGPGVYRDEMTALLDVLDRPAALVPNDLSAVDPRYLTSVRAVVWDRHT